MLDCGRVPLGVPRPALQDAQDQEAHTQGQVRLILDTDVSRAVNDCPLASFLGLTYVRECFEGGVEAEKFLGSPSPSGTHTAYRNKEGEEDSGVKQKKGKKGRGGLACAFRAAAKQQGLRTRAGAMAVSARVVVL